MATPKPKATPVPAPKPSATPSSVKPALSTMEGQRASVRPPNPAPKPEPTPKPTPTIDAFKKAQDKIATDNAQQKMTIAKQVAKQSANPPSTPFSSGALLGELAKPQYGVSANTINKVSNQITGGAQPAPLEQKFKEIVSPSAQQPIGATLGNNAKVNTPPTTNEALKYYANTIGGIGGSPDISREGVFTPASSGMSQGFPLPPSGSGQYVPTQPSMTQGNSTPPTPVAQSNADFINTQGYQDAKARSRELMPASAGNLNDQILYAQNNLGRPEADQVGFMTNTSGISKGFPVNPPNPFMKQLETQAPTPTPTDQTTQQTVRNVSNVDEAQKADALKAQYETSQQARYRKALLDGDYALADALEKDSKARGWALPSRQEIDTLGMQNFNATQNLIDQIPTAPTPTPTSTVPVQGRSVFEKPGIEQGATGGLFSSFVPKKEDGYVKGDILKDKTPIDSVTPSGETIIPGEIAPKKDVEKMFKEAVVSKETPFMKEPAATTESKKEETIQSSIQDKTTNLFNDQVANLKQQAEDQKKALQYKAFVDSQKLMQRIADRGLLNSGIAASMMLQKQAMDNDALSRVDANTQKLINDLAGKNLTAEAQREATATRLKSAQEINAAKLKSQEDIADAKLTASNFTDKVKSISAKIKEFGTLGYDVRGLEKLNRLYTEGQLTPKEFTAAYNKSLDDMGYTQKAALEMGQKASQAQLNLAQAGLAQAKTIGMYSDADGNLRHADGSVVMVKGKPVKTVKQINTEEKMEIERQLLELKKKAAAAAAEQLKTASGYKFDKMALDYQKFISDVEKTGFTEAQKSERTKINRYLGDLSSLNSSGLKATDQNYIDQKDRIAKALNESFNKMDVNLTSWLNRQ